MWLPWVRVPLALLRVAVLRPLALVLLPVRALRLLVLLVEAVFALAERLDAPPRLLAGIAFRRLPVAVVALVLLRVVALRVRLVVSAKATVVFPLWRRVWWVALRSERRVTRLSSREAVLRLLASLRLWVVLRLSVWLRAGL